MAVGLSNGQSFADEGEYLSDLASRRPPGGSQEPAGASNSTGGTQTPGNTSKVDSLPDFTNQYGTPDKYKIWPERLVDSAISAVTLPGDAWQGKVDPMSEEGLHRSFDLASLMVGGPSPFAGSVDGTLGSFAGVKALSNLKGAAKSEAMSNLGHAQILEAAGEHPDVIWKQTGFGRGADGRWRHEIDDSKATLADRWVNSKDPGPYQARLGDVLNHPELYQMYPHTADIRIQMDPKLTPGNASWNNSNTITVGSEAARNTGTIMHEVQHAIQDYEGFAKGGSPGIQGTTYNLRLADAAKKQIEEPLRALVEKRESGNWTEADLAEATRLKVLANKYLEYSQAGREETFRNYERLAGEAEARNTDIRLLMSKLKRRDISPRWTMDVKPEELIVRDRPQYTNPYMK